MGGGNGNIYPPTKSLIFSEAAGCAAKFNGATSSVEATGRGRSEESAATKEI